MTTILVVDDETDLEPLLTRWFRRKIQQEIYAFRFAKSGHEALRLLQNEPSIDILLLDINMPDMDGLTLLGELPAINPVLRAVMVSAYGDMNNIRTAMNRGAFDFVCKPIDFADLELTIEKTAWHVSQLRESRQLKVIDELKTRFFDNITHEFRTPLTLILSPVEKLLAAHQHPIDLHRGLLSVERNARQLLRLINQLLDLAQLESGHLTLSPVPGNLGEYIEQIVQAFIPVTHELGLELIYRNELSGLYAFDPEKIEQIVYNLIANAVKFTAEGAVTVTLKAVPDQTAVHLIITDTGLGILPEKLPYIFNRFYQAGNATQQVAGHTTYTRPGSGIGLALVKELTELMGGTVSVTSTVARTTVRGLLAQHGTTVTVTFPLLPVETTALVMPPLVEVYPADNSLLASPLMPTQAVDGADLPLLLIVDDNDDLRAFLATELATRYRVLTAPNGRDALVLAQAELPDVVISDVVMPLVDGYQLTQHLKTHAATDHIAVVLLTAKASQDSRMVGLAQGADDYLAKPFHLDELHLRLHNLLTRQQNLRTHYQQQLTEPDIPAPLDTLPNGFLHQLYKLLEQHLDNPSLTVEWVADELAMSRKTLYRKVHSLTQFSPNELIRQYRLRRAADLLRTGHTASEAAYMVGFETPSHFTRSFKEFYQQTPTEFVGR